MRKLTKKAFLESTEHEKLFKKVLNQGGIEWGELITRIDDYMNPGDGSVNGLIYYADTVKFGKRNHLEILKLIQDLNDEGMEINPPDPRDETDYFNWMAWFTWESMVIELSNKIGY